MVCGFCYRFCVVFSVKKMDLGFKKSERNSLLGGKINVSRVSD